MQFDQRLGQWQAEAGSLVPAAECAVDLTELRERLRNVLERDADAGVGDLEYVTAVATEQTLIVTLPPASVNLIALDMRFTSICFILRRSAYSRGGSSGSSRIRLTPCFSARCWISRQTECANSGISMSSS